MSLMEDWSVYSRDIHNEKCIKAVDKFDEGFPYMEKLYCQCSGGKDGI